MTYTVLLCAILSGPFDGMTPCVPYVNATACQIGRESLSKTFVHASRCDVFESLIENGLGSMAPILAPVPQVKVSR